MKFKYKRIKEITKSTEIDYTKVERKLIVLKIYENMKVSNSYRTIVYIS